MWTAWDTVNRKPHCFVRGCFGEHVDNLRADISYAHTLFNVERPGVSCFGRMQATRVYGHMCRRHGGPRDKEARQSERQSVITRTTHAQRIEQLQMTKQSDSKHFFPYCMSTASQYADYTRTSLPLSHTQQHQPRFDISVIRSNDVDVCFCCFSQPVCGCRPIATPQLRQDVLLDLIHSLCFNCSGSLTLRHRTCVAVNVFRLFVVY